MLKIIFILFITTIHLWSNYEIMPGTQVAESDKRWKFIVSLQYLNRKDRNDKNGVYRNYCGGSLIAPTWILTSAGCLSDKNGTSYHPHHLFDKVAIGNSYNLNTMDFHTVSQFIIHKEYKYKTRENDIGLIKLTEPILNIKPISYINPQKYNCIMQIAGWGKMDGKGSYPVHLMAAEVDIVSNRYCNRSDIHDHNLTKNMLCAGGYKHAVQFCAGDKGGPLIKDNNLIGIASWGNTCGDKKNTNLDIYTKVESYIEWIGSQGLDIDHDGILDYIDTDDDNDGISDKDEVANGLDPLNPLDAQLDADDDGFTNLIEIIAGSDIHDAESRPIWAPVFLDNIMTFVPYFDKN